LVQRTTAGEAISRRALNRATLDRQLLLRRSTLTVPSTIEHLVGMQAQTPHTAYVGLWTRLADFRAEELSDLLADRSVVRMALMRGTIHLVTARDAWGLRPLVQPVMDRVQKSQFGKRLAGVDLDDVVAMGRAFVDEQPRTFKALGDHLLTRWPDRDRFALEQAVRTGVSLVQVPPRGLWGRSGPIAHTSIEAWLGEPPANMPSIDTVLTRYVAAFGPVTVMDAQVWCGLTKLGEVFERLRPGLIAFRDEAGRELFDLPDAPRPDPDRPAPPRFLYDFENLLLSYADRSRMIAPETVRGIERTQESLSTFTLDGFVAGIWGVQRDRGRATLTITPHARLSKTDATALADEGAGLLAFLAADAADRDIRFAEPRM
jgi:Winged helix DNA-binding domain